MLLADLLLCYSRPCSFSGILADLLFPPCYESKLTNTSCYPTVVCSWEPHCCFLHACYWFMLSFSCLHGNCSCLLLVLYDHSRFFMIKLLLVHGCYCLQIPPVVFACYCLQITLMAIVMPSKWFTDCGLFMLLLLHIAIGSWQYMYHKCSCGLFMLATVIYCY